jgi:hypothetical protein
MESKIDQVLAKEEDLYVYDETAHDKLLTEKPWMKE